jgi:hypothetical protein
MGSSLTERAELYRRLAETLSNADDVETALELANHLDDLARLEFPTQVERNNPNEECQWLKHALNCAYKIHHFASPIIEILFEEVVFGEPGSTEKVTGNAKDSSA